MSCGFLEYSTDFIALLGDKGERTGYAQFYASFAKAVNILRSYPGVISDDYYVPHLTIQYLCCYTPMQWTRIIEAVNAVQWAPFNLTFQKVICNNGGDGFKSLISLIIVLDQKSQTLLGNFVDRLERAIKAAGIPIHRPRTEQELFHSTLGVVTGDYPVAKVMDQINTAIKVWNTVPMMVDSFWSFLPPWQFHANDTIVQRHP
jgi:2'-5' RNA ligase